MILLTKRFFYIIIFFGFLISCTHSQKSNNIQYFKASKGQVWEALIFILKAYPLKIINEDNGYIETEILTSNHFWKAPHEEHKDFSGYSSILKIKLSYEQAYSVVFIDKKVYKQKGFISLKQEVLTNFLEEEILLYKLHRELKIRNYLKQSSY